MKVGGETLRSPLELPCKAVHLRFFPVAGVNMEGKRQPPCTHPNGEEKRGSKKHWERRLALCNEDKCCIWRSGERQGKIRGGGGHFHRLQCFLHVLHIWVCQPKALQLCNADRFRFLQLEGREERVRTPSSRSNVRTPTSRHVFFYLRTFWYLR